MAAYLDHAASTPVRPEAVEAMLPFLAGQVGNPSGAHRAARCARRAIDEARDAVATLVGCEPTEVVFTSGGTEADNAAVAGIVGTRPGATLVSAVEHHAVLEPAVARGATTLPVDGRGRVDGAGLDVALAAVDQVALASVMLANNEVGTVQPLADVARAVRAHTAGAVIHTDAVQAAAWLDLPVLAAEADLVSLSAHKLGGPAGVGALVVRRATPLAPLLRGGGQELGRRAGTPNVAGIVGFGAAATQLAAERPRLVATTRARRDRLAAGLLATLPDVRLTVLGGGTDDVLPGHLHVCLPGVEAEVLLFLLDAAGISASAASSCASGAAEPSHVLAAMGIGHALAAGSLRLSLGWSTTDAEVDEALTVVPAAVARARGDLGATGRGAAPGASDVSTSTGEAGADVPVTT